MSHDVGVWFGHKKAVIVSIAAGHVTTKTLTSDVGAHPRYSDSLEGAGEKHYEERLGRSKASSERLMAVESMDKLTDPQIVAKVKEHFGIAR